ncbi:MAG: hypothetical protein NC048_00995 [Bacteroides sp.]|nr:hypothetical protein [Ruminococcus flavefaciens]MCM1554056.1 hypothetical protein [Bacteroides sp.]
MYQKIAKLLPPPEIHLFPLGFHKFKDIIPLGFIKNRPIIPLGFHKTIASIILTPLIMNDLQIPQTTAIPPP